MMVELLKCFLYGLGGFAVLAAFGALLYFGWPYAGWAVGGIFFVGICIGLGADMRSDFRRPR